MICMYFQTATVSMFHLTTLICWMQCFSIDYHYRHMHNCTSVMMQSKVSLYRQIEKQNTPTLKL